MFFWNSLANFPTCSDLFVTNHQDNTHGTVAAIQACTEWQKNQVAQHTCFPAEIKQGHAVPSCSSLIL